MAEKVLLIRNIEPNKYGGAESYQLELAKILLENQIEPIIVTSSKQLLIESKGNKIKAVKAPFIKRQNWSGVYNLLLPIYALLQMRLYFWYKKQFKKYRPAAINIQSRDDWIAATLAGHKLGIKVLWTDHIDFRTWVLQNINVRGKNFIAKYILKLAKIPHAIIMISDFEKEHFIKAISPRRLSNIKVIKNGVIDELNNYKNIKPEPKSFCYVGRIVDYKGINELINAFLTIKDSEAELHIYGTGESIEYYKNIAAMDTRIKFHGYTNQPLTAIAGSKYFVLPSYYEGMSISLLQAIMLERQIITTNIDGNPEIVDNRSAILIPARSTEALADAMRKLLVHPNPEMAKQARQKYEREFNFTETIKRDFIPLIKD